MESVFTSLRKVLSIRSVVGMTLFLAGMAKWHSLWSRSAPASDPFTAFAGQNALPYVVAIELGLAAWLFSGFLPRVSQGSAALLFIVFACVSLTRAVRGHQGCGCLGAVQVDPWLMFSYDLLASALLVVDFRKRFGRKHASQ
jgi:uncharacterized membrane protein YphA (DoxX/SURF4 family)